MSDPEAVNSGEVNAGFESNEETKNASSSEESDVGHNSTPSNEKSDERVLPSYTEGIMP